MKGSILRCSGQKLSYLIFFRGVPSNTKLLHLIFDYGGPLRKTVILVRSFPLADDCWFFWYISLYWWHKSLVGTPFGVLSLSWLKLCEWLNSNKLSLNVSTSNFVIFHPYQRKLYRAVNLKILDNNSEQVVSLQRKTYVKYLGVLIDGTTHGTTHYSSKHLPLAHRTVYFLCFCCLGPSCECSFKQSRHFTEASSSFKVFFSEGCLQIPNSFIWSSIMADL